MMKLRIAFYIVLGFFQLISFNSANEMTCDNGKLTQDMINDDYCDCLDGKDEPITSACSYLPNTSFQCINQGYIPVIIPAVHVNDGICDCCDGSDETMNKKGSPCKNTCPEKMKLYRENLQHQIEILREGTNAKSKLITDASIKKKEKTNRLKELKDQIEKQQSIIDKNEKEKEMQEEKELDLRYEKTLKHREDFINALGLEQFTIKQLMNIIVDLAESMEQGDTLFEVISNARKELNLPKTRIEIEEEEYQLKLNEQEKVTETNDEPNEDKKSEAVEEDQNNGEVEEHSEDSTDAESEKVETKSPPRPLHVLHERLKEDPNDVIPEAENARQALEDSKNELNKYQKELDEVKSFLELDFGPNDVFLTLKDQCFRRTSDGYEYSVCFYSSASQDHVHLGTWKGFNENLTELKYADGTQCWNGPQREITVNVQCGKQIELKEVLEREMCIYVATLLSPIVCSMESLRELENSLKQIS